MCPENLREIKSERQAAAAATARVFLLLKHDAPTSRITRLAFKPIMRAPSLSPLVEAWLP